MITSEAIKKLQEIHALGLAATTQDQYTAAGEKAIRALPEIIDLLRQQTTNPPEIGSKLVGGVEDAQKDIDSPFNACMYRDHCRSMQAALAQNAQVGQGEAEAPFGYVSRNVAPFRSVTPQWQFTHHRVESHGCIEAMPLYTRPAERARVPEDTARLDYLIAWKFIVGRVDDEFMLLTGDGHPVTGGEHPDARAAIDEGRRMYPLAFAPSQPEDAA